MSPVTSVVSRDTSHKLYVRSHKAYVTSQANKSRVISHESARVNEPNSASLVAIHETQVPIHEDVFPLPDHRRNRSIPCPKYF